MQKINSIADLAATNQGELSAAVISQLKERDEINVGKKKYLLTKFLKGKKHNEFINKKGEKSYYTKTRITFREALENGELGHPITGYLIQYKNGFSMYFGESEWKNFSREIESDIIIDLINAQNPFHEKSESYKLAESALAKIKIESSNEEIIALNSILDFFSGDDKEYLENQISILKDAFSN
jgi:hypothetical protein